MNKYYDFILPFIIKTWDIIEKYQNNYNITSKEDSSPVTEADIEASNYLKNNILKKFPSDIVFTEEDYVDLDFNKRTWLIDPLDWTKFFIEWKDTYSIIISCIENSEVVFWIIYYPKKKTYYYAEKWLWCYFVNDLGYKKEIKLNDSIINEVLNSTYKPSALNFNETINLIEKMKNFWNVSEVRPSWYICTEVLDKKYDLFILWWWKIFEIWSMDILFNEAWWFFWDMKWNRLIYTNDVIRFNFWCIWLINKNLINNII